MTQSYPDDSIQSFVSRWWIEDNTNDYRRGRLIWAYLPHVAQVPSELIPIGRPNPVDHFRAEYQIRQLNIHELNKETPLPVAGLPIFKGERRGVYVVKKRPAVVLFDGFLGIEPHLAKKLKTALKEPRILIAPAYTASQDGTRAGSPGHLRVRFRHCEFPHYLWDMLPLGKGSESIFRFDEIQPLGRHHHSVEFTKHCLSPEALSLLDEWLVWLFLNQMNPKGDFCQIRETLMKYPDLKTEEE